MVSSETAIFAEIKESNVMEKTRYPQEVHDWIDDLDWSKFPSQGPFSEEEAIARIDQFEDDLANGRVKWIRVDDLHTGLKKLHPWL